jgi:hypothetical protein
VAAHRLILPLLLGAALWPLPSAAAEMVPGRVSVLSELRVEDEVEGDVVALGGDVVLASGAAVHGHAIAVLGRVVKAPGSQVDGRVIAVSSLANLTLDPSADVQLPYLAVAVRLLSCGGWLLVVTVLAFALPVRLRLGVVALSRLGLRVVLLGVLATITLFAALVAALSLGPGLGVPLTAGVMLLFLATKAVGLTVVGGLLGELLLRRRLHRPLPLSWAVFVGVAVLLILRVLPVVGGSLWSVASVVAVGAGLFTLVVLPQTGGLGLPIPLTGDQTEG